MTDRTIHGHATFGDSPEEAASTIRGLTLPDVIDGRYRVLGRVGAGTMGIVLRAEDLFLQRPVAIKIVEPAADQQVAERFVKEAQALAQVRHENVVQVYAFGRFQTASYLAMELVVGHSLESMIDAHAQNGATIALPRATAILRAMAAGLDAVHARQLVHRDVKPANVIIEKNTDRPVLIDFGLARKRSASNPRMSITGGTPSYMAPEQAQDPHGTRVTARTDLYALACTAFELFTGRPVFEGNDIFAMLLAHMNDAPRKISAVRPELAPFDDVLLRALAKDPAARHASASEMIEALHARLPLVDESPAIGELGPQVLVVANDTGFRRSLIRNTTQTLKTRGHEIVLEEVTTSSEAVTLGGSHPYDLLVIDDESMAGRTGELVRLARRKNPEVEIVVVSRDLPATLASLGEDAKVRHMVPKPLNVHVLAAVLGRTTLGGNGAESGSESPTSGPRSTRK
ncbi:MAG: protein kinase [Labilithrix sp.]|nr:protein kinase [Labilithrix sp.]MCW5813877.1 protein kinase [Labilithrix sp.]